MGKPIGTTGNMWVGFVEKQSQFIGGRLTEHDDFSGSFSTEITGMELRPNGDSLWFAVNGKDFSAGGDIRYLGIRAVNGTLQLHSPFGAWWLVEPAADVAAQSAA